VLLALVRSQARSFRLRDRSKKLSVKPGNSQVGFGLHSRGSPGDNPRGSHVGRFPALGGNSQGGVRGSSGLVCGSARGWHYGGTAQRPGPKRRWLSGTVRRQLEVRAGGPSRGASTFSAAPEPTSETCRSSGREEHSTGACRSSEAGVG